MTFGTAPGLTAAVRSTSRSGQVGVISGASTWLSEGTAVGAKYGSSRDQPYLNLRPFADSASSPSVTTYTFASPTPNAGWTFVLGDIDADRVQVDGVTAEGVPATAAQLGFRSGFNYCASGTAGKPSCTGDPLDVPAWDPAIRTLTGNAAASDTSGAAAWFEPNVPLSSLTMIYTARSGFPIYQTWFASIARDISGTVADPGGSPVAGTNLNLFDPNGAVVGTTTTDAAGAYSFPGFTAADGYAVEVQRPLDKIVVGPNRLPADLAVTDAVDVNFVVRDTMPVPVSGRVIDTDGNPVPGATVTLDGGGTTVTNSTGLYIFDTVAVGDHSVTVAPVDGFVLQSGPAAFTVPAGVEDPITGLDFVLIALPSLSGSVTTGGEPAAGVTVTVSGPGGSQTTITAADGSYIFTGLAPGSYDVTATTANGTYPLGPTTQSAVVARADVIDVDFVFAREGSISGNIADTDGNPIENVDVTVTGPTGPVTLTTDSGGRFVLAELAAGDYEVTAAVPAGYEESSAVTLAATITSAGETVVEQNFVFSAVPMVTPDPAPVTVPAPVPVFVPAVDPPVAPVDVTPVAELANSGSVFVGPLTLTGVAFAFVGAMLVAISRRIERSVGKSR
ncbi:MSCRAMM family protein [Cryobacterium adonitolivorans]|nr:carboxypeptidase regulatory-like domain-containing protein [Cryobacterium adonitolivorans]